MSKQVKSLHRIIKEYHMKVGIECGKKELDMWSDRFTEFCAMMGIFKDNMQKENHRYEFIEEDATFIDRKIFACYTIAPILYIRCGKYDKVSWNYYRETERFVRSAMKMNGKDMEEISSQISMIRHKTRWIYRRDILLMKVKFSREIEHFYESVVGRRMLGVDDKLEIFKRMKKESLVPLEGFFKKWSEIVEDFSETRINEMAEVGTDEELELLNLSADINDEINFRIKEYKDLVKLRKQFLVLESENKRTDLPLRAKIGNKVIRKENQIREEIYKQHGITDEKKREIRKAESGFKNSAEVLDILLAQYEENNG
ncbi:hypothetical protein KL86CLO1_11134 [uncultured Eubacteriales bacterium]|uniref:Uncharacterized protein n=1 Tax=uncultured Eubacteriales bacterium TaxID=172733 RepID=A0A212JI57_9FIRM|nr:hypothetical protein KL86CLO1_11134 [uncultured Eubacteriales bacterium]